MKLGWVVTCTTHCPVQFFLLLSKLFVWPFSQFGPCYWLITFQVHEVRRLQPHLHKVGLNWSKSWANDGFKNQTSQKIKKGTDFQFFPVFDHFLLVFPVFIRSIPCLVQLVESADSVQPSLVFKVVRITPCSFGFRLLIWITPYTLYNQ